MAGDATGIIAAATVTSSLHLPMAADCVVEYATGFAFGLFVFQALFMKDVLRTSYREAVRQTWLPEWLSMNAVMAGMIPVVVVLMTRDMGAMEPSSPRFWAVMSLASLVGSVLAYPVNYWLVKVGLKHGMGTERALGKGGVPMQAMPGMSAVGAHPTVGLGAKVAVTAITLGMLALGVMVAARFGDFAMRDGESGHVMVSAAPIPRRQ